MAYLLDNIDLSTFGWIPGKAPGSNLAIEGIWDLPARQGKSYHSWGEEDGIEPYTDAAEIQWAGRDLTLYGLIRNVSEQEALQQAYALIATIDSFNDLVTLATPYGDFQVYVSGASPQEYMEHGYLTVRINMREPVVDLSGGADPVAYDPSQTGAIQQINAVDGWDGVSWSDQSLQLLSRSNYADRPQPKSANPINYDQEPYRVTKREARSISYEMLILTADLTAFSNVIKDLYKRFSNPGLRYLTIGAQSIASFLVFEGWQVRQVKQLDRMSAVLTISGIFEASEQVVPALGLVDSDLVVMTDLDGKILLDES